MNFFLLLNWQELSSQLVGTSVCWFYFDFIFIYSNVIIIQLVQELPFFCVLVDTVWKVMFRLMLFFCSKRECFICHKHDWITDSWWPSEDSVCSRCSQAALENSTQVTDKTAFFLRMRIIEICVKYFRVSSCKQYRGIVFACNLKWNEMKFIVVLQPKGWIATIQYMYSLH